MTKCPHRRAWGVATLAACAPLLTAGLCGGDGSGGRDAVIVSSARPECEALVSAYPPGLDVLPDGRAIVATDGMQTIIPFVLGGSPPLNVGVDPIPGVPVDSDGDGEIDLLRSQALGFFGATIKFGRVRAVSDELVLVASSGYEEVIAYDPTSSAPTPISVTNPATSGPHDPADHPFLPTGGTTAGRTAIATRVCVRPPDPFTSAGAPVTPGCDPDVPSFWTSYTAGLAVVDDVLVVATSNLASSERGEFRPGTVLLFSFDDGGAVPALAPLTDAPVRFTTAFNPTSVTPWTNASGRPLALIGSTGAILPESGPSSVRTDAAIDVLDVATRRIAATIPMGPAALEFAGLGVDAASGLAVAGSGTMKHLYAVDLAVLDDESIFAGSGPPVVLDGTDPVHPDARIYTGDAPFEIPRRIDGPAPRTCDGWTNVLVGPDRAGDPDRRDVYVTDRCDGTLTILDVDLTGATEIPLDGARFRVERQLTIEDPFTPESVGGDQEPNQMVLGPAGATPGAAGPALYYLVNLPEALFCALEIPDF